MHGMLDAGTATQRSVIAHSIGLDLGARRRLYSSTLRAMRIPRSRSRFMARVTVEDCLELVPNRFALVHLGVKRARELMRDAEPLVPTENRECVTALREVAANRITIDDELSETLQKFAEPSKPRSRRR